ncbi:MAG: hypothetical protein HXS50_05460, partial [Theionarchaea archaeon]|nr:hypothetical protein [Theionarchaea archaeon]
MDDDQDRPTDTFFIIPHTHWEGAVFKTREEYLEMGLPNILVALDLLGKHPGYRFTLDQSCYVEPFIQRYPEEGEALRGFVREGRLEIAGGTHVMPDVNMPGGESFIRQVLYGRGFFRREIGVDVSTAWLLDTFGHHPQMPQLLRLSGYRFLWFFRGVEGWDVPSEFVWEGIDGSRIPAIWLPRGYAIAYGSPGSLPDFSEFIEERFRKLDSFTRGNSRAGPAGADVCRPEEHLPRLIEEYNRRPGRAFDLLLSTPSDYERAVEACSDDLKVFGGELNPIFQGTYSSRIELKQLTRKLEGMIGVVEKLGAILQSLGKCVDNDRPWLAWEPLLFNHAHDLMSGVMTDRVYGEVMGNYGLSLELAGEEIECRMRDLSSMIDTRGEGIPIVVFNPLGWSRTDPVEVELDLGDETLAGLRLVGPDGKFIPLQLLSPAEGTDKIAFIAGEVPPLGHSIYRLVRGDSAENIPQSTPGEKAVLENRFYRIEIEPATGAVQQIKVRNGEWDALDGQGNVVAVEEDNGDFWELYRPLDGGSRIAMKDIHPPPRLGEAAFSTDRAEAPGRVMHGPVFSEFTLSHSLGEYGRFDTRIR